MDPLLDTRLVKLAQVLSDLVRLHDALADVLDVKVRALAKLERARLAEVLQTEEALLAQIGIVDGARQDLVREVAKALGLDDRGGSAPPSHRRHGIRAANAAPAAPLADRGRSREPVRLGVLVRELPAGPRKDSLGEIRGRLEATLARVRRLTVQARALTEQSLAHVRLFLSVLSGAAATPPTYDRRARSNQGAPYAVVDRRA